MTVTDKKPTKVVAVFGGSFDPPTTGHIDVALGILNNPTLKVDEVWLMPCIDHCFGKVMTDFSERMKLCALAVPEGEKRIIVSDFESEVAKRWSCWDDGSTMKTAMNLAGDYEDVTFKFVIGLDNALDFGRWKHFEELRIFASFIVVPRPGYVHIPGAWYTTGGHRYLEGLATPDMSSTKAREALHTWKDRTTPVPGILKAGLSSMVLAYIVDKGIYSPSQ